MGAQTMFRQIGATVGVAAFVAMLGTPHGTGVIGAFNDTRIFMIAAAAIAAASLLAIRPTAKTASAAATSAAVTQIA